MKDAYLDAMWSKAVKLRTGYQCEWCPNRAVHAHHMVHRDSTATRWHLANGVALCKECHDYWDVSRATGEALFRKYRPQDWELIDALRFTTVHKIAIDFRGIAKTLREALKQYEDAA